MAPGKRDHVFVPIDGKIFYLFREIPQANDIRLHRQHFLFYIQEHFRQRLPGKAATSQTDKIIAAENIQHRCAVVHRVAFDRQSLLLWFIAAQNEKQIVAILLIQVFPGRIVHRQMVGRDDDNGIFKPRRRFDFVDKLGDVFLAATYGAKGLVGLAVVIVAFAVAGA